VFDIKWRVGCQAFDAKINLIHMRPAGILSMLYFARNAPILSKKNKTEGADDLEAIPDSPVRARAATAPGNRIVRAWRAL
jgi:hypothetical protein